MYEGFISYWKNGEFKKVDLSNEDPKQLLFEAIGLIDGVVPDMIAIWKLRNIEVHGKITSRRPPNNTEAGAMRGLVKLFS